MEEQFINLIRNGNLQEIQEFYNNNPNIDISADDEYAFCFSCGLGLLEVAKWLLKIKTDINISVNNELIKFVCLAFPLGYIIDIIIDKFKIFGNELDLYYKTAGAGLWGALAFVFSIIISYLIQNIIN